jgi:hypothetical protein
VRAGVKYEVGDALPLRRENEEAVLRHHTDVAQFSK